MESPDTKFRVLATNTWPSHEDLGLNESQFEAYQLALTHEFAVIQGPPGTGKTYLGVKVAKTLFENAPVARRQRCLMLIICYTNHALDQFLEHILDVTTSVVRIGGQSKNEAMEKISLNNLRRTSTRRYYEANNLFHSEKRNLKILMGQLQRAQNQIESLCNGILTYASICQFVPEVREYRLCRNSKSGEDKLFMWLFENIDFEVDGNIDTLLEDDDVEEHPNDNHGDKDERTAFVLEDLSHELNEIEINGIGVQTTFILKDAQLKLRRLVSEFKNAAKIRDKQLLEDQIREIHYIKSVFLVRENILRILLLSHSKITIYIW